MTHCHVDHARGIQLFVENSHPRHIVTNGETEHSGSTHLKRVQKFWVGHFSTCRTARLNHCKCCSSSAHDGKAASKSEAHVGSSHEHIGLADRAPLKRHACNTSPQ